MRLLGIGLALGFALALRMAPAPAAGGVHAGSSTALSACPTGDACRARGEFSAAAAHYRRALEADPGNRALRYRAFEMTMYVDPAEAAGIARRGDPGEAALHLCVAEAVLLDAVVRGTGRDAALREAAERVARCEALGGVRADGRRTGDVEAVRGEMAIMSGDLDEAREQFRLALRAGLPNPDRAVDVMNALAFLAYRQDDAEEARQVWRQAIARWRGWRDAGPYRRLAKDETMAFYLATFLGDGYQPVRDRPLEAADRVRAMMAAVPPERPTVGRDQILCFYFYRVDRPMGHAADSLELGDLLWLAGRRGQAVHAYRDALEVFPRDVRISARLRYGPRVPRADALLLQARAALDEGRYPAARSHVDAALALTPEYPEVHAHLATLAARTGDYPAASRHALQASSLAWGVERYAVAAVEATMAVDPEAALMRARELPPSPRASAYVAQASVLAAMGATGAAREGLLLGAMEAAASAPRGGDTAATLAEATYLRGRLGEAEDLFRRALQLGVTDPERQLDIVNAIGWIRFRLGDVEGARVQLRAALDLLEARAAESHVALRPRWESYCTYLRVLCGEDVGLQRLLAMQPRYDRIRGTGVVDQPLYDFTRDFLVDLARLRAEGKPHEAIARIVRFRDAPDPPQTGPDRMVSFYSEAIEEQQDRLMVLLELGDLCREAGRLDEARRWYRLASGRLPGSAVVRARLEGT